MNDLISPNQNASIPGRNIMESSLLTYEMARSFNKKTNKCMRVKVDLQNAFDKINRKFMVQIMTKWAFPLNLHPSFTAPSFSIIINGTPQGFSRSNRGIRQGDPLSPFLFAIAMDHLSINLENEYPQGKLSPPYNINVMLTDLIYADDLLMFSKAKVKNANSFEKSVIQHGKMC